MGLYFLNHISLAWGGIVVQVILGGWSLDMSGSRSIFHGYGFVLFLYSIRDI